MNTKFIFLIATQILKIIGESIYFENCFCKLKVDIFLSVLSTSLILCASLPSSLLCVNVILFSKKRTLNKKIEKKLPVENTYQNVENN